MFKTIVLLMFILINVFGSPDTSLIHTGNSWEYKVDGPFTHYISRETIDTVIRYKDSLSFDVIKYDSGSYNKPVVSPIQIDTQTYVLKNDIIYHGSNQGTPNFLFGHTLSDSLVNIIYNGDTLIMSIYTYDTIHSPGGGDWIRSVYIQNIGRVSNYHRYCTGNHCDKTTILLTHFNNNEIDTSKIVPVNTSVKFTNKTNKNLNLKKVNSFNNLHNKYFMRSIYYYDLRGKSVKLIKKVKK